jgi:hypothetical protein
VSYATVADMEDAIRAWVKAGTGFDDAHVFFSDQKIERPSAGPYATIRVQSIEHLGALTDVNAYYDAGRDPGTEIELRVECQVNVVVQVQIWKGPTVSGSLAPSSVSVANQVQLAIELPSVREALDAAGMSPHTWTQVQNLGALLGTAFEGRATFEVEFYAVMATSEYTGYIAEVDLTDTGTGVTYDIT